MLLSNDVYNVLKKIVQIVLPALATLYVGLGEIWHFPNVAGVVGTITLVTTFFGVILGVSTRKYNNSDEVSDGDLLVSEVDGEKFLALGANKSIDKITAKNAVRFNVVKNSSVSK